MKIIILVVSLCFIFNVNAGNYQDVKVGLCGPSEKMYSYIEESGYQVSPIPNSVLSGNILTWSFFPKPERVKKQRLNEVREKMYDNSVVYSDYLEILKVVHQDASKTHPEGWTCISESYFMFTHERKGITDYFEKINKILK